MSREFKIRVGAPRDLEVCLDLLLSFYSEENIETTVEKMTSPLGLLLRGSNGAVFLAEKSGQIAGIAVVALAMGIEQGGMLAELTDLYVLPEFRRGGVGGLLAEFATDWARENNCRQMQLLMTPKGQAMAHLAGFYEQLGFQNTGRTVLARRLGGG